MNKTVKECMDLDVFKNARLLAGAEGVENVVTGLSVLDMVKEDDVKRFNSEKGLLFFMGFLGVLENERVQCRLIQKLAEGGHSGLVIMYMGRGIKELDTSVIRSAESANLPLIVVDDNKLNYSHMINAITGDDKKNKEGESHLISEIVKTLLDFDKHSNFESAIKEAAVANDFQVILLGANFNPIFTVETRKRETIQEAVKKARKNRLDGKQRSSVFVSVNGIDTYWRTVRIEETSYYMFLVDNEDMYTSEDMNKLSEVIELSMGMWNYKPKRDSKTELIRALVRGNKPLAYSLNEEAKIKPSEILSVFFAKDISSESCEDIFLRFEKEEGFSLHRISDNGETYGMITRVNANLDKVGEFKQKCSELYESLKGNKSARIFHITGIDGIDGVADAYKEIEESWSFAQNIFPYKRVFTKYEMALVSNCIDIEVGEGKIKKNYIDLLAPFALISSKKREQLLGTLETFVLDSGMNAAKTSELIGIHINTMKYRLRKINALLGVEITGNRVIPGLTIAVALKRLEKLMP